MHTPKLYFSPGSCSLVTLIALHETGADFCVEMLRLKTGQHKTPQYLALNPKGKVPTLVIDGQALTENVAILTYLNGLYPGAGLLPATTNQLEACRQTADLCFVSATLHPIITRMAVPMFMADGEQPQAAVRAKAYQAMIPNFDLIDARFAQSNWWYGDTWSVMDAYLYWIWYRAGTAYFDRTQFSNYASHAKRMEARPSVQKMLAENAAGQKQLESEGLAFTPPK